MKIIARQGDSRFLLDCETLDAQGKPQAQIIDTRRGLIWSPTYLGSILARGYWRPITISPAEQGRILSSVTPAPTSQPSTTPWRSRSD